MRLEAALLSGLFSGKLCSALGSGGVEGGHALHHRHADFHENMRREAEAAVHQMEKRVNVDGVFGVPSGIWPTVVVPTGFTLAGGVMITPVSSATKTSSIAVTGTAAAAIATESAAQAEANAIKSVNTTAWTTEAETACMSAVMSLKGVSSNPAGLAVCYNVPYLDEEKGVFEAELRMYNICAPTSDFVGISPTNMMVTLSYGGATIQQSDGQVPVKRELIMRQATATTTTTMAPAANGVMMPVQVAVRQYVGQVNKDLMTQGMNLTEYRSLLVPSISISAVNPVSQNSVNTSLSSTEASFNAGVFSKAAVGNATDPKSILGKPEEQIAAAEAGQPTPFDVPGLAINVSPVGLIVTSVWVGLFFTVVGLGTFGRMQFRDQYRRAVKAQGEERQRRI